MDDFISSKGMITPGVAGSATTMITGTLVSTFGFPGAITALAISFLFGLLVLADKTVSIVYKLIYYIISSMTIFSVAVGLNQAGMVIVERDKTASTELERTLEPEESMQSDSEATRTNRFFQEWF
jgi:hypothetical protein